ncbi:Conserved_hypothetical protein [Hexamita inflata]|uniref:Uncharacterized protein n=1 Tax=Hexamita inflata TaxID=28002 RepID=A0AA86QKK3_9EUKA|nr:Conserved hypothetical protein [Hexamita inflata]
MWAATSLCLLVQNLKQIADCYSPNTVVQYRDNINQLVIKLDSNNNSACEVFPDGVDVNVTLGEINPVDPTKFIQPISRTILNFNYKTSKELYLNDIEEIDVYDINMILIEIYSYAEITEIHGCVYQSSVSSLTDCFYPNTSILIRQNDFLLSLHATGLCRLQIDDMDQFNILIDSEILYFDTSNADLLNLKLHYGTDKPFSVTLPGNYMRHWDADTIQARIVLSTKEEFDFNFDFIDIESVQNIYQTKQLMRQDSSFGVYVLPNQLNFQTFLTKLSLVVYDSFSVRLNFQNGFVLQQTLKIFNQTQYLYHFKCGADCRHQYSNISTQPVFELIFYAETESVLIQTVDLYTCPYSLESATLQMDNSHLRLKIVYNGSDYSQNELLVTELVNAQSNLVQETFMNEWSRNVASVKLKCNQYQLQNYKITKLQNYQITKLLKCNQHQLQKRIVYFEIQIE